ncbi:MULTISPECIES: glycosyltransferase [Methylobacter]
MPKVSVILTSFNHDKYLHEAIDSVLKQTFTDFEMIIWDDASVDDSWEIIQSYSDQRIQAFQNPQNQGPVFGVNKAIFEVASGEYIAIHHSDDIWELDKLAKQVAFLAAHSEVGAVFSNAQPIDQRGMPLTDQTHFYYDIFSQPNRSRHEWLRYFFLKGNALCHPSILIRKQCYVDCGAYRDMLAQLPDFDMWIRLCAKYEIHIIEDRLIKFRILDTEMNASGNRAVTRIRSSNECYKLLQQYRTLLRKDNIFKTFPDFISYDRGEDTDPEYVLTRVCLESGTFFLRQMLAIEILFDILNNSERRQVVEKIYGFSSSDFIAITGQCDLFSGEELVKLHGAVSERDKRIGITDIALAEAQQFTTERLAQIKELSTQIADFQQQEGDLRNEIEAFRLSTSWRITKPLREVSELRRRLIRLVRVYQSYRPGVNGFKRLSYQCIDVIRKEGFKGLRKKIALYDRIIHQALLSEDVVTQQCESHRIDLLLTYFEKGLILNSTVLFDHNGGGGSNAYTNALVKIIHAEGGTVLRVYCFDAVWFVQWSDDEMLFSTSSIEELFEVLSASRSQNIIINSIYGYPDIKEAIANIVVLAQVLSATLDFKIHDFYGLCPSPHLSDFEDKYCGVPQDVDMCRQCLKKNHNWYHSWFPQENKPIDIITWRQPFAELFKAATTISVFDSSVIEILDKAFSLEQSKIRIVPHDTDYFKCDKQIELSGPLHIGVLGTLSVPKGGDIVNALYDYIDKRKLKIPVTVVGSSYVATHPKITVHGNYAPDDLPIIISKQGINVILMPSIIPETFSYTISEAMKMGLPIVAFDIGAQGNRVKQYELGKVVPLGSSPDVILSAIQSALITAQELKK